MSIPRRINKKEIEFSKIYYEYSTSIHRYCFYRVYSKEYAQDIMQDVFIKTWRYLESGKKIKNPRPFLYRVAHNLIIDFYRSREGVLSKKQSSLDEMMENNRFHPKFSYSPEQSLQQIILLEEVLKTLGMLPKTYQDIIILAYVEDLTLKEIARILNISEKSVFAKKKRAIEKLNKLLKAR